MSSVTTRDEAVRGAKALADYADRMYSEASTVPVGQDMADEIFELMGWAKEHGSKPGLIVMPSRSAEQTWLKVKHSAYAVLGALGETYAEDAVETNSLNQRPKPVARCTNCGTPSYNAILINGECGRMVSGKRCAGTNGSTMQETDWEECPACSATGWTSSASCGQCDGVGWLFVRGQRR
jgi:hypothetical protein